MSVLFLLLPLALLAVAVAVIAFIWAVRRGQFDDLETPPRRILLDEPNDRQQCSDVEPPTSD